MSFDTTRSSLPPTPYMFRWCGLIFCALTLLDAAMELIGTVIGVVDPAVPVRLIYLKILLSFLGSAAYGLAVFVQRISTQVMVIFLYSAYVVGWGVMKLSFIWSVWSRPQADRLLYSFSNRHRAGINDVQYVGPSNFSGLGLDCPDSVWISGFVRPPHERGVVLDGH